MVDSQLRIGAQSRAASGLAEAIPDVVKVIEDLATQVEPAMAGFKGGAASGFAEAVSAWFEVARELPDALGRHSRNLALVDQHVAATEAQQQESYSRLASRLGGGR